MFWKREEGLLGTYSNHSSYVEIELTPSARLLPHGRSDAKDLPFSFSHFSRFRGFRIICSNRISEWILNDLGKQIGTTISQLSCILFEIEDSKAAPRKGAENGFETM